MSDVICIYGLRAEPGSEVRYVGRAKDPAGRLTGHLSRSAARGVREWVESLGRPPDVVILQECGTELEAQTAERFWIAKMRNSGAALLNRTWGGEPGKRRSRAARGFGLRVLELRTSLGLTQADLARASGVPAPTVCRVESGKRDTGVTAVIAVALARALGTTVEYLVTGELRGRATGTDGR